MQRSDPLWSVLLQFPMCVLQNVVLAKSRAGAGVLCCFHLQLWQRGSSLFAPSFCCVAFYSTTTTGAWPCWEKGYVLVSYFLPFSIQYISASRRWLMMHTDKGESQNVAVKEYEFYNRGLALSDLSWLLIGWFLQFLASDWLGPEGCSLLLLLQRLKDDVRNVDTWWDPPGRSQNCAVLTLLRETCLPVGWRHFSPLLDAAKKGFLVIGCPSPWTSNIPGHHYISQS